MYSSEKYFLKLDCACWRYAESESLAIKITFVGGTVWLSKDKRVVWGDWSALLISMITVKEVAFLSLFIFHSLKLPGNHIYKLGYTFWSLQAR